MVAVRLPFGTTLAPLPLPDEAWFQQLLPSTECLHAQHIPLSADRNQQNLRHESGHIWDIGLSGARMPLSGPSPSFALPRNVKTATGRDVTA